MAMRPLFTPCDSRDQLVREIRVEFTWHPGMALSQKRKSIESLHAAREARPCAPLLEVSSKSPSPLGVRLSAFNMQVELYDGWRVSLESAFQGSKVFQFAGPFTDLLGKPGHEIKKDPRLQLSGRLTQFQFKGERWELEPKTAFYDWLYLHALHAVEDLREGVARHNGFTDIEFNPKRSINCQARSCALYVSLCKRGILDAVLRDKRLFLELLRRDAGFQPHSMPRCRQTGLFDAE